MRVRHRGTQRVRVRHKTKKIVVKRCACCVLYLVCTSGCSEKSATFLRKLVVKGRKDGAAWQPGERERERERKKEKEREREREREREKERERK